MGYQNVLCNPYNPASGNLLGPPGLLEKLAAPVKPLAEGEVPTIVKLDLSKYEPPARLRKK